MIIIYDFSLTSFHEISKKCHILSEIECIILRKIWIWDLLKFLFLVTFFFTSLHIHVQCNVLLLHVIVTPLTKHARTFFD